MPLPLDRPQHFTMPEEDCRLVSDLPMHIFERLLASKRRPHASAVEASALHKQLTSKLKNSSYNDAPITTVPELLKLPAVTLLRRADPLLTHGDAKRLLSIIHDEYAIQPSTALSMLRRFNNSHKIPTGLTSLDRALQGGIPAGSITEVFGRAGVSFHPVMTIFNKSSAHSSFWKVGKTHMTQQLCTLAAIAGGGSIFIDTENKLSLPRLQEIAIERSASHQHPQTSASLIMENVSIHQVQSTKELLDRIDELRAEINHRNSLAESFQSSESGNIEGLPVRLIVIDSIAAPIRRDYDMMGAKSGSVAAQRASAIFQIARRLKQLAYDHGIAVVAINQVGGFARSQGGKDVGEGSEFTASLGTAWQYCVSTRIVLEHNEDPHQLRDHECPQQGNVSPAARMATLSKSLVSSRTSLSFQLTKMGLCELSEQQ